MAGLSFLADACALIIFHGTGAERMTDAGRSVMEEGDVSRLLKELLSVRVSQINNCEY